MIDRSTDPLPQHASRCAFLAATSSASQRGQCAGCCDYYCDDDDYDGGDDENFAGSDSGSVVEETYFGFAVAVVVAAVVEGCSGCAPETGAAGAVPPIYCHDCSAAAAAGGHGCPWSEVVVFLLLLYDNLR